MPRSRIAAAVLLGAIVPGSPVGAAVGDQVVWELSAPLDGAPAASIGSVLLSEGANYVEFTLTAAWSEAVFGTSAFISRLEFVYQPVPSPSFIDVDGVVPTFSLNPPTNASYTFALLAAFPTSSAPASNRLGNGDFSVWRVLGTTLSTFSQPALPSDAGKPPAFALAQLQGALNDASYKYVAPVPEPGTWLMMLAGLAGIAGVARRRLR